MQLNSDKSCMSAVLTHQINLIKGMREGVARVVGRSQLIARRDIVKRHIARVHCILIVLGEVHRQRVRDRLALYCDVGLWRASSESVAEDHDRSNARVVRDVTAIFHAATNAFIGGAICQRLSANRGSIWWRKTKTNDLNVSVIVI